MSERVKIVVCAVMLASACGGSSPTTPTVTTTPATTTTTPSTTPTTTTPTTTTPTNPSTPTATLTGLVREYASAYGELDPVADARVEVLEGAASGRSAVTAGNGGYRLEELPIGTVRLRITKTGFQALDASAQVTSSGAATNLLVRRDCSEWPAQILEMMSRLTLPSGLCLVRQPSGRVSNYHAVTRIVYLRGGSPVGGELGTLAHELGHAHQHQAILAAGLAEPGSDEDFIPKWASTSEGRRFVQLTGWRHDPSADQRNPPFGWSESCEQWSCGYQNPIEDSAQFTANWYNPGGVFTGRQGGPEELGRSAPNRSTWASEFLPR